MSSNGATMEMDPLAEKLQTLITEGGERFHELMRGASLTSVLHAISGASRQDLEKVALFAIAGFVREEAHEVTSSEEEAQAAFNGWIEGGDNGTPPNRGEVLSACQARPGCEAQAAS